MSELDDDGALAGIDDDGDDGDGDAGGSDRDEHGNLVCPDCGDSFENAIGLGVHRKRKHGILSHRNKDRPRDEKAPKRKSTRRRPAGSTSTRRQKLRETIEEAADFLDELQGQGAGVPERLADILRIDADKLAGFLTVVAERVGPLAAGIDAVAGKGGPLSGVRAFWRVLTWLSRRSRQANREAAAIRNEFVRLYNAELDAHGEVAAEEFRRRVEAGELIIEVPAA